MKTKDVDKKSRSRRVEELKSSGTTGGADVPQFGMSAPLSAVSSPTPELLDFSTFPREQTENV
jgi:hypothetical protein